MIEAASLLSLVSGAVVGIVLGLVGGGGSILAVPLLVYVVDVEPTHVAIGTSALAVSVSAFASLVPHARAGHVKWRCAFVFAGSGVLGALAGAELAKAVPGDHLLVLFGGLMVVVGLLMFRRRDDEGNPDIRLGSDTARELLPLLVGIGFAVGALSGFFGIGGGFLIVPGLILATGMPLIFAIGTSLVAVGAFGAATAASYTFSGLINWNVAAFFVLGGLLGGLAGMAFGRLLAGRGKALGLFFASIVVLVGIFVLAQGAVTLVDANA